MQMIVSTENNQYFYIPVSIPKLLYLRANFLLILTKSENENLGSFRNNIQTSKNQGTSSWGFILLQCTSLL